jgi:hypothetical protein
VYLNFLYDPQFHSKGTYILSDWHDNRFGSLVGMNYNTKGNVDLVINNQYGSVMTTFEATINAYKNYASGFWVPRFSYA